MCVEEVKEGECYFFSTGMTVGKDVEVTEGRIAMVPKLARVLPVSLCNSGTLSEHAGCSRESHVVMTVTVSFFFVGFHRIWSLVFPRIS